MAMVCFCISQWMHGGLCKCGKCLHSLVLTHNIPNAFTRCVGAINIVDQQWEWCLMAIKWNRNPNRFSVRKGVEAEGTEEGYVDCRLWIIKFLMGIRAWFEVELRVRWRFWLLRIHNSSPFGFHLENSRIYDFKNFLSKCLKSDISMENIRGEYSENPTLPAVQVHNRCKFSAHTLFFRRLFLQQSVLNRFSPADT